MFCDSDRKKAGMTNMAKNLTSLSGAQMPVARSETTKIKEVCDIIDTSDIAFVNTPYDKHDEFRDLSTRYRQELPARKDADAPTAGRQTDFWKGGEQMGEVEPGALNSKAPAAFEGPKGAAKQPVGKI